MTSAAKHTAGPCVVIAPSLPNPPVGAWICTVGNNPTDPAVFSTAFGPNGELLFGDKLADATLIAEAFTVAHETGLTPRQLAEQRDELLAAAQLFSAAARDAVRVLNARGIACPASIALAAEKARTAIAKAEGGADGGSTS